MTALGLVFVWKIRLRLRAKGSTLWAKGDMLRAKGDTLRAEGNTLRAEGNTLWAKAILEVHGNIEVTWKTATHCVLSTGEEFTEEMT